MKFGWLLAPTLDGPELVFSPDDEPAAELWRERLRLARERFRDSRRYMRADLPRYKKTVKQLRRAWRELVSLSVGYTYVGAELEGRRVLFAFDVPPELRA